MPIVASPSQQAWIRVSPSRRKIDRTAQTDAFKGTLSYFSCQPVNQKPPKLVPCPKYDIDDLEPLPKSKKAGPKDRTVSAPAGTHRRRRNHHEEIEEEDDDEYNNEDDYIDKARHRRSPPSRERSRPPPSRRPAPPVQVQPRATSAYWTGPTKRANPPPRSYTSSQSGSSRSTGSASARWANATAPLDLG